MPPFRFTSPAQVIYEQFVGHQPLRQQDSIAFPGFDISFDKIVIRREAGSPHLKPFRRLIHPKTYRLRRARMLKFIPHGGWHKDAVVEFGQHLNFAD